MPILRPHAARFHERRISSVTVASAHLYGNVHIPAGVARALADWSVGAPAGDDPVGISYRPLASEH